MNTSHSLLISAALLLCLHGASSIAQDNTADFDAVREDARQLMASIGDYSADQRDEAVAATKETLDKLDQNIEVMEHNLREQWASMDTAAREQSRETMRALREERNELAQWYGAMKNSSANAWDEMKSGFSEAFESLGKAWDKAVAEYE